jgi:hypothetical protein
MTKAEDFIGTLDVPFGPRFTLKVTVGHISKTYIVKETNAPESYDGFGTITINDLSKTRIVLIEEDNFDWQSSRYYSGTYALANIEADGYTTRDAANELYARLVQSREVA